ncbi:MAG: tail fiber domain-containing protein [Acidobacteriota bacterium]|nr:tail fiber domain-containing protein [Acidobacteriota bacterium]
MKMRAASIRAALPLVAAILMTAQAVQAQYCPNNTAADPSDVCLGEWSLLHEANGYCNTAIGAVALQFVNGGVSNTAVGCSALRNNVSGSYNTAVGAGALNGNLSGFNTAIGHEALVQNKWGGFNTAGGSYAAWFNANGNYNTVFGAYALKDETTGDGNTVVGSNALQHLASGGGNLALGGNAGLDYNGGESNNVLLANFGVTGDTGVTRIGTNGWQTKAFVAGIYGTTSSGGTWVMVNSSGQLGTPTSSLRFKEDVSDLGAASAELMRLRPVSFRYKAPYDDGQRIRQYGLIAEEVAEIDPGLVQFGEDGKPLAVRYHFVDAMLLNEVQKQHSTIAEQSARLAEQAAGLARQASEITSQKAEIGELALRLARLEGRP